MTAINSPFPLLSLPTAPTSPALSPGPLCHHRSLICASETTCGQLHNRRNRQTPPAQLRVSTRAGWGGRTHHVLRAQDSSLPRQGSFFTRNSSRAIHPPPTRTITVLRRMRTSRSCWESPNCRAKQRLMRLCLEQAAPPSQGMLDSDATTTR